MLVLCFQYSGEAIGKVGDVREKKQVTNSRYRGTRCSRIAKYNCLGSALYWHKGWAGYFSPKIITKK